MNKKLLKIINSALERTKTTHCTPAAISMLQGRLIEELDWFDADPVRCSCLLLLNELTSNLRSAGVVVSPGYSFLTDSLLMYLAGVTSVNPVEWDLPFSCFTESFCAGDDLVFEAGSGGMEVVAKALQNRKEIITSIEPGSYRITFLDGNAVKEITLHILEYPELDCFKRTVKHGWRPLDAETLRLFSRASTDNTIWFEADKIREWLFEFNPESMSDLCLLRSLFRPDGIKIFPEILAHRKNPETIVSTGNAQADSILRESYGILVYREQAIMLQQIGSTVETPLRELCHKGHNLARTMLSVEAVAMRKHKTSL